MPSAIETLMASVEAQLVSIVGDAALVAPHLYGERYLFEHKAPPVVIWVPSPGSYRVPLGPNSNPIRIWTKVAPVDIHIWARTPEEAEELEESELSALHDVANGYHAPTRHAPNAFNKTWLTLGAVQVLTVEIQLAVQRKILPTAPVVHYPFNDSTLGLAPDGWLDSNDAVLGGAGDDYMSSP